MTVVTWLAVFPVVSVIFYFFSPWLNLLPTLLRTLVFTLEAIPPLTPVSALYVERARRGRTIARNCDRSLRSSPYFTSLGAPVFDSLRFLLGAQ